MSPTNDIYPLQADQPKDFFEMGSNQSATSV